MIYYRKYFFGVGVYSTIVTPGLLQKISKKCNSPVEFPGLVVFLAVFFRKFDKKSQNVTVRAWQSGSLFFEKNSRFSFTKIFFYWTCKLCNFYFQNFCTLSSVMYWYFAAFLTEFYIWQFSSSDVVLGSQQR